MSVLKLKEEQISYLRIIQHFLDEKPCDVGFMSYVFVGIADMLNVIEQKYGEINKMKASRGIDVYCDVIGFFEGGSIKTGVFKNIIDEFKDYLDDEEKQEEFRKQAIFDMKQWGKTEQEIDDFWYTFTLLIHMNKIFINRISVN